MSYSLQEAGELVIRAGKELLASGLIARTWGNISARISDSQFLITPSGMAYDNLRPEDLVVVGIQDGSWEGIVKPSSEKGVHAAAYRQRPDVNFVLHTHQDYATALSVLGRDFVFRISEAGYEPEGRRRASDLIGPVVPTAAYALSSTKKLTGNLEECIWRYPSSRAFLMRNHGTLILGRDYDEAFAAARVLESVCRKKYISLTGEDYPERAQTDGDHTHVIRESEEAGCFIETNDPFIVKMSSYGETMRAYVDDLAQMTGAVIECLSSQTAFEEAAGKLNGGCRAFLVKGRGAVCAARSEDDALALASVLAKGCQAALLDRTGNRAYPVGRLHAALEHLVYTKKYSKIKDRQDD